MRYLFFLLFSIILMVRTGAQSADNELKLLMEAHSPDRDYYYKVSYNFYGNGRDKPLQSMEGVTRQFGDAYYFRLGNIEQATDKTWTVTINGDEKYVICDKTEKYAGEKPQTGFKEVLTAMRDNGDRFELDKTSDKICVLKIFEDSETTPSWQVAYERETKQITSISIFFNAEETAELYGEEFISSRLDITVDRLDPAESPLRVTHVINESGTKVELQQKYKKYTLYDLSAQN